jgi:phosphopantetheine adenylyltransferase
MGTSYSQETAQTIIEQYKFRVEALSNKIEELQAKIEVTQIFKQNG